MTMVRYNTAIFSNISKNSSTGHPRITNVFCKGLIFLMIAICPLCITGYTCKYTSHSSTNKIGLKDGIYHYDKHDTIDWLGNNGVEQTVINSTYFEITGDSIFLFGNVANILVGEFCEPQYCYDFNKICKSTIIPIGYDEFEVRAVSMDEECFKNITINQDSTIIFNPQDSTEVRIFCPSYTMTDPAEVLLQFGCDFITKEIGYKDGRAVLKLPPNIENFRIILQPKDRKKICYLFDDPWNLVVKDYIYYKDNIKIKSNTIEIIIPNFTDMSFTLTGDLNKQVFKRINQNQILWDDKIFTHSEKMTEQRKNHRVCH